VIIGGVPNFNLYRLKSDEEFAAVAAASSPVYEFIAGDSKCSKFLCACLKKKYAGAVRRRDTGDAPALEDFEAICDATYKERNEGLMRILALDEVSALFGKTSWRAVARYLYIAPIKDGWDFEWPFCESEDDESCAYRNYPSKTHQYIALFFVGSYGVLKAGLPRGLNFGLKLALLQYSRKPGLIAALLRLFLMVNAHAHVGDYQLPKCS
jgi:hypothetical protein